MPASISVESGWYYEEYVRGAGVTSLGLDERPAPRPAADPAPDEDEKKSILDLFRR